MPKLARRTVNVGGSSTCRADNSFSSSDDGNQKHEETPTDLERSLRQEKGSCFGADAKPGKGDCIAGRNPKWHEESTIAKNQHNVLGFRDARKAAIGVQSCDQPVKTKIAAIPRSSRRSHTWAEVPGTSGGPVQVSRTLQTESAGDHGVGQYRRKTIRRGQRGGRRARRLH